MYKNRFLAALLAVPLAGANPTVVMADQLIKSRIIEEVGYNWFPPVSDAPVEIEIDLSTSLLFVLQDGRIIGASEISTGTFDAPTPVGDFLVSQVAEHYVSRRFDGAVMPYSVFFGDEGYAIHAGDLGGASAGCVRIPLHFAEVLFSIVRVGTPIKIAGEFL